MTNFNDIVDAEVRRQVDGAKNEPPWVTAAKRARRLPVDEDPEKRPGGKLYKAKIFPSVDTPRRGQR